MEKRKKGQDRVSCEVCGNSRKQCFEVRLGDERHVFDSFECAMRALSPKCTHCGCQLIGQGVQVEQVLYCSYSCANADHIQDDEDSIILNERADF